MRQFQTSVLELREDIADGFATQPFECAWAAEAIFFVHVDDSSKIGLTARVQVSPDGLHWLDEGTEGSLKSGEEGFFLRVREFGGWLRLRFTGTGSMKVTIRLALKE